MEIKEIIKKAFDATKNSYSPYSNYKVGACIEMQDGSYFLGTNIENAAYGSSMCAERNAVYAAYCNGYHKNDIKQLAIVSFSTKLVSPCGACRQVLGELLPKDCPIILANLDEYQITTINELMPMAFEGDNLNV
ncbi:cytidine deaminase [uncultured Thomasclavelia sp.]|uniref:cytidine deaminase n=1 Tax=uncultured Thomasclavelia sp. TaxID=3025759 RepID=UPI0025F2F483|nr:cytidine deaminase [uncultured Thomasclavelia sp.]